MPSAPDPRRLGGGAVGVFVILAGLWQVAGPASEAVAAPGPPAPLTSNAATAGGWPLRPQPELVRGFIPPEAPWAAGHRGVDLAGRVGQPVHSALPGRVSFAGRIAGRGVVVVDHGGFRTTYEPVAAAVEVGAAVRRGDVLGTLEWFGTHCSPRSCLHWGLVAGSTYLDPLTLVGGGPKPVRLLPLGARAAAPVAPGSPPLGPAPVQGTPTALSPVIEAPTEPVAYGHRGVPGMTASRLREMA